MNLIVTHSAIILLVLLHEIWLYRTIEGLWSRTGLGRTFPKTPAPLNPQSEAGNLARSKYLLALQDVRFCVTVSSNRLLAFVSLVLVASRRDSVGYVLSIVAALVLFWLFTGVEATESKEFFA